MRTEVTILVDDVLGKLQPLAKQHRVERLSDLSKIVPDFEIEVSVDAEAIAKEAGYVDPDECHKETVEDMEPSVADLRDGLRALLDGDRTMAAVLLCRAFDEWGEARLAVEEVLLGRTVRDRRQFSLLAA
ncbi:hypothetical protein [Sphingobium sp. CFD-2]|uniref:hypothetical protein n=1 Tax=Sphingobium sp. CFD-2 TaxID=2878542 RepID=UPI00214AD48B|nr:hypothetical protein [Sphingobium sp. CFD-2]